MPKRTGRKAVRADRGKPDARLDRQSVHGEESVVFSGSIAVEFDSEGSIVSACSEH